jgi:hypothetical protein
MDATHDHGFSRNAAEIFVVDVVRCLVLLGELVSIRIMRKLMVNRNSLQRKSPFLNLSPCQLIGEGEGEGEGDGRRAWGRVRGLISANSLSKLKLSFHASMSRSE